MRDRHIPRLCDTCAAPMARQEAACWNCGTQWAAEDVPQPTLRVIPGGAGRAQDIDEDRWIMDGGSYAYDAAAQMRISTASR
jgi:hypothetical protein